MSTKAYGSITIVDISDIGTLSVVPESNQPNTIIYDPDIPKYNPTWSTENPLTIKPVIYYSGQSVSTDNCTIGWKRQVGTATATDLTGIVVQTDKSLKITSNDYPSATNPLVKYICTVTYKEPISNKDLTATGEITFSVLSLPGKIATVRITGSNVFTKDGNNNVTGAESITLTPNYQNCSYSQWQFKSTDGWKDLEFGTDGGNEKKYGNLITLNKDTTSLTISKTLIDMETGENKPPAVFINNRAEFQLITSKTGVVDTHSIVVIKDGAAGDETLYATLSNEDIWIPCDSAGVPTENAFSDVTTTIKVYNGDDDVTSQADIEPSATGVDGSWATPTYTVNGMNSGVDTGSVVFTIKYGTKTITKTFNLTKLKAGTNGVTPTIYSVKMATNAIKCTVDKNGNILTKEPNKIQGRCYSQTGNATPAMTQARFAIYGVNSDDTESKALATDDNTISFTYSFESKDPEFPAYRVKIFSNADTKYEHPLDSQSIIIIKDGTPGEDGVQGPAGTPALTFLLNNQSDVIPCSNDGKTLRDETIEIPFTAYWGNNKMACRATYNLPTGWELDSNDNGGSGTDGKLTFKILEGTSLADAGTIPITIIITDETEINKQTVTGTSSQLTYSWSINRQALNGQNAIFLRTYAPNGNIIENNENDVILKTELFDGSTIQNTGVTYKWAKWNSSINSNAGGYQDIDGETSATYTVNKNSVDGYASFRVIATYKSKEYYDYISVQDKTDPLHITIISSIGDKIVNGTGKGCVWAKVEMNGEELDPMQNLKIQETEPTNPNKNDIWVDIRNSQANIKRYSGTQWQTMTYDTATTTTSPDFQCLYEWDYISYASNVNGESLSSLNSNKDKYKKFFYVDGSIINKKVQFNVEVTKK